MFLLHLSIHCGRRFLPTLITHSIRHRLAPLTSRVSKSFPKTFSRAQPRQNSSFIVFGSFLYPIYHFLINVLTFSRSVLVEISQIHTARVCLAEVHFGASHASDVSLDLRGRLRVVETCFLLLFMLFLPRNHRMRVLRHLMLLGQGYRVINFLPFQASMLVCLRIFVSSWVLIRLTNCR
jgi:hypothetical protein